MQFEQKAAATVKYSLARHYRCVQASIHEVREDWGET